MTGDAHTYVLVKTPTVLLCNMRAHKSVRHRQNQEIEKKSDYSFEYFSFKKNFRLKITQLGFHKTELIEQAFYFFNKILHFFIGCP